MAQSKKEDLPQEDPKESKESKEYVEKKTKDFIGEEPKEEPKEEEKKEEPKEEEKPPEIDVEQLKADT